MAAPAHVPGISEKAVKEKTGRTWPEWFRMLDAAGARKLSRRDITGVLRTMFDVSPWWQAAITEEYERARGLRQPEQRAGAFAASVTRTFGVPRPVVVEAFENGRLRTGWLRVSGITLGTGTPGRLLRLEWPDGSRVDVRLVAKRADRCTVTIEHTRLNTQADVGRAKAEWKAAFERLRARLES